MKPRPTYTQFIDSLFEVITTPIELDPLIIGKLMICISKYIRRQDTEVPNDQVM